MPASSHSNKIPLSFTDMYCTVSTPAAATMRCIHTYRAGKKAKKIIEFNTWDSHMVTHWSTNPAIRCLCTAEGTGCETFIILWPNTLICLVLNTPVPPVMPFPVPRLQQRTPVLSLPPGVESPRRTQHLPQRQQLRMLGIWGRTPAGMGFFPFPYIYK